MRCSRLEEECGAAVLLLLLLSSKKEEEDEDTAAESMRDEVAPAASADAVDVVVVVSGGFAGPNRVTGRECWLAPLGTVDPNCRPMTGRIKVDVTSARTASKSRNPDRN